MQELSKSPPAPANVGAIFIICNDNSERHATDDHGGKRPILPGRNPPPQKCGKGEQDCTGNDQRQQPNH